MIRRPSSQLVVPAARAALPLALAALLPLAACDDGAAGAARAVRTDSAGVTLVVNDGADRPLAWTFTQRFAVGGEESGPESFYGISPRSVGGDARSNLYVLDGGNLRVLVFDSSGAFVREQGGKGGGPGELQFPGFLEVRADGVSGVYDHSREGLVRWSATGEPLTVEQIAGAGGPPPQLMRAVASGRVVQVDDHGSPERPLRRITLELRPGAAGDGVPAGERPGVVTLAALEMPVPTMHMYASCTSRLGMALGPIFEPELVWTAEGGRVFMAHDTTYVVDVHDGSRLRLSIRRATPARRATREMAVADLGEGMKVRFGGGECTIDPGEMIEARGVAPVLQPVDRIVVAPDGTVWVTRGAVKGEPRIVDVFDAEGEYLGTLPAGAPEPAAFLANGDLVAIEKDELDVERIAVYRVGRTEPAR